MKSTSARLTDYGDALLKWRQIGWRIESGNKRLKPMNEPKPEMFSLRADDTLTIKVREKIMSMKKPEQFQPVNLDVKLPKYRMPLRKGF